MGSTNKTAQNLRDLGRGPLVRLGRQLRVYARKSYLEEFGACLIVSSFVIFMVRTPTGGNQTPVFKTGEIATETVRADNLFLVTDSEQAKSDKAQFLSGVAPVYDLDSEAVSLWMDRWQLAIKAVRKLARSNFKNQKKVFEEKLGFTISDEEFLILSKLGFSPELEKSISFSLGPLWDLRIVENKNFGAASVEIVDIKSAKVSFLKPNEMSFLIGIEEARALVGRASKTRSRTQTDRVRLPWSAWPDEARGVVFSIQARLVQPNVTLNRKETEVRRDEALKDFKPSMAQIEKGEVIVREGEKVSKRANLILEELSKLNKGNFNFGFIPFEIFLATLSFWFVFVFLRKQFPRSLGKPKDLFVLGVGIIASVATLKLVSMFQLEVVAEAVPILPPEFFLFCIPIAAPAMVLRLLVGVPLAALFSLIFGTSVALMLGGAGLFGLHVVISGLMASHFLKSSRTRSDLHWAGTKTAFVMALSALGVLGAWGGHIPGGAGIFQLETRENIHLGVRILWIGFGGLLAGWVSTALTLFLTPLLENILDYTTDLKLLELARMDHPLLKELVLKAPGTYHHSIIVGSLVEAGAEAIGANSLLARVGSYYHDIGKMNRAEYFVENQSGNLSPHDTMSPQLSAKLIISHVKEGRVLAEEHKLGQDLIDFIEQHHATTVVTFFYNKAKQEAAKPGSKIAPDEIREADFRYPGPKPQTREAAIMALADSCEAATRSLVEPTPARIEGLVNKIINRALNEGVLDEADITFAEVNLVSKAFLRILLSIHHNRIQYPDQEKGLPAPFKKEA